MSAERVAAGQLVFTRVEEAYSPRAAEGYQTVWSSRSLTAAVVEEIKERVCCLAPHHPPRLQFSPLRAGGFFVAKSRRIRTDLEVNDRNGRKVFLAHAGWVGASALSKLGCDPFVLLGALGGEIEDFVTAFGRGTGTAPELEIETDGSGAVRAAEPGTHDSEDLVALAGEVVGTLGRRAAARFFLVGDEARVEESLARLFALLPPAVRRRCSFDTQIDGCTPGADYALLSGSEPPRSLPARRIDLANLSPLEERSSIYAAWLRRALAVCPLAEVARQTDTAYRVFLALDGGAMTSPGDALERDVCREILEHEPERLRTRLAERLPRGFGRRRIRGYCGWLVDQMVECGPERLIGELLEHGSASPARRWREGG